jgi:hypothetical protein
MQHQAVVEAQLIHLALLFLDLPQELAAVAVVLRQVVLLLLEAMVALLLGEVGVEHLRMDPTLALAVMAATVLFAFIHGEATNEICNY